MSDHGSPQDPRFTAAIDLLNRTGSSEFQIRYDDEQDPIVWVAVGVTDDWEHDMPLNELVCWWVYDPELQKFRRGCEAEHAEKQIHAAVAGRNDPCPCGSGKKFKKCCLDPEAA